MDDDRPWLSIITATFNAGAHIGSLATSIASQDFRDFEWIVQDGGSTDSTARILRSTANTNLRLASEPDSGIYDALNNALDKARGEYVLFLGADDRLIDSTVLADLHSTTSKSDAKVVLGRIISTSGVEFTSRLGRITRYINSVHHQGALYRRDAFAGFRYDLSAPVVADYELNLLAYRNRWSSVTVDRVFVECGDEGISNRTDERALYRDMRRLRRKHMGPVPSYTAYVVGVANLLRRKIGR